MSKRIAILISGRGSNMEAILRNVQDGFLAECCTVSLVVSNCSEAEGLEKAASYGVPTACVPSKGRSRETFERALLDVLAPHHIDYVVLAGFMRILSPVFVQAYRGRIVNIHPADTTAYQGARGYEWAFENGLEHTKVTVHIVDEGIDTGPVIACAPVDLRGASSLATVKERGLAVEHRLYSEALHRVFTGFVARLES
jgi:phosphoribosylglycinamide formyltransferase-1